MIVPRSLDELPESITKKYAASAPTRGNFMMASDVPAFRSPSLRSPLAKEGDADFILYSPGDFKPVDIMKKKAAELGLKVATDLRAPEGSGLGKISINAASVHAKGVGAPKVTAAPGPSIADQSKPSGFGLKLPGAIKGKI